MPICSSGSVDPSKAAPRSIARSATRWAQSAKSASGAPPQVKRKPHFIQHSPKSNASNKFSARTVKTASWPTSTAKLGNSPSKSAQTSSASFNTPSVPGSNQKVFRTSPSPHSSMPGASAVISRSNRPHANFERPAPTSAATNSSSIHNRAPSVFKVPACSWISAASPKATPPNASPNCCIPAAFMLL